MAERLPEATNQPRSARERRRLHLRAAGGTDVRSSYDGIGADLKAARLRRDLRLSDVAAKLRIREVYLAAMEEGRFVDLPGPVYAAGFVRTYGEYIGLNGDDCVVQFKREDSASEHTAELHFPTPANESRLPGRGLLAVSLAIAIGLYAAWYYGSNADRVRVESVPAVPERLATGTSEITAGAAIAKEDPTKTTPATAAAGDTPPDGKAAATARSEVSGVSATSAKPIETAALKPAEPAKPAATPALKPTDAGATKPVETMPPKPTESGTAKPIATPAAPQPGETASVRSTEAAVAKPTEPAATKPVDATAIKPVEATTTKPVEAATANPVDATTNKPIETSTTKPVDPMTSRPATTAAAKPPAAAGEEAGIAARRPGAAPARSEEGGQDRLLAAVPTVPESRAPTSGGGYVPQVLGAVGASRVTLIAKVDSWVQIRGTNSELLLTRVLRAGDKYHVPNRSGLTLMTGNAGAIEIAVDGKSLPPLGPVGEVRRDVSLDPDELLKGGAAN